MKALLFDIDHQLDKELVTDAYELLRTTREYDIQHPEPGKFLVISRQPDYYVELSLKDDGTVLSRCHCVVYKKTAKCKHAVAAMLLIRDHLKKNRKEHKKQNRQILNETLHKLNVTELREFVANYAMSHSALRSEILSNYLYRTKKPDYQGLFNDLTPIDKYGQIKVNRNSIKSVRSVSTNLLKRAQQLLKDQSISEALSILEAAIIHLHKLHAKLPQFQDQLMSELKFAYRIFELLCTQPMAPRLQQRATTLSVDVCSRESYTFPAGMRPLISVTENFFLEAQRRKDAFAIAEQKVLTGSLQSLKWIALLYHWMRIWQLKVGNLSLRHQMEKVVAEVVREFSQQSEHDDVLYVIQNADKTRVEHASLQALLQSGLRSARALGQKEKAIAFAYELVLHHLDQDAWQILYEIEPAKALHVLKVIEEHYSPSSDTHADMLLLKGWTIVGNGSAMVSRLKDIGDFNLLMEYDHLLKDKYKEELEWVYAEHIHALREAYGGIVARQKLNNIFSHLKATGLYTFVAEKIKMMEKGKTGVSDREKIKGFVFDLDGVIVDTAVHHFNSWKRIMKELGADISEEDDHHTRGAGRMESLQYLLDRYHIELTSEEKIYWAARKNDVYLEAIESITPSDLLPGTLAFLKESRNLGLSLALGSASKNAGTVLEKLGIADKFDAIVDGNDIQASKPDPEIFQKACEAIGLHSSAVVVFEDAPKGIQAALSAGCKAVGIGQQANLSEAHIVIPGLNHLTPSEIIERLA